MQSRRHFLHLSSAVLAAALLPETLLAQSRAGIPPFSPAGLGAYQQGLLTRARFESLLGSSFRVFLDEGRVADLTLVKVTDPVAVLSASLPESPQKADTLARLKQAYPSPDQSFTLQFSCGNTLIPQDTYTVDHGTLGSFALFLVPGGTAGNRTCGSSFNYASGPNPILPKSPIRRSGPVSAQLP